MAVSTDKMDRPAIIGRSSSLFTRVARIFAVELDVEHDFEVVADLMSTDPAVYGDNPALKLPTLRASTGTWFGALNICRELARHAQNARTPVWPEDLDRTLPANAQELVTHAMATEVALIMTGLAGNAENNSHYAKQQASLDGSLAWLEQNIKPVLAELPDGRDLSYLEVSLYCLVTHLAFREIRPAGSYPRLDAFARAYGQREACAATVYRFDPA